MITHNKSHRSQKLEVFNEIIFISYISTTSHSIFLLIIYFSHNFNEMSMNDDFYLARVHYFIHIKSTSK